MRYISINFEGNHYVWQDDNGDLLKSLTIHYGSYDSLHGCVDVIVEATKTPAEYHLVKMFCPNCNKNGFLPHSESEPAIVKQYTRSTYNEWHYNGKIIFSEKILIL